MNIGQRIKERRKELDMSVEELANKLGKNRATVYRYEKGDIENLPMDILDPLSKALQTSPQFLLGWDKPKEEEKVDSLLGINMKRLRILRNVGIEEFAKELNIPVEVVQAYESGRAIVPYEILGDLANYFEIPINDLVGIHIDNSWLSVTKKWIDKIGGAPLTEEEMDKIIDYAGYLLYMRDQKKK